MWSPGTFMDWYRELVVDKYTHRTYPARRGRPAMDQEAVGTIVRLGTENGLKREHIFFFEDITTREVWCGSIRCNPDDDWMVQIARNQCQIPMRRHRWVVPLPAERSEAPFAPFVSFADQIPTLESAQAPSSPSPSPSGGDASNMDAFRHHSFGFCIIDGDNKTWRRPLFDHSGGAQNSLQKGLPACLPKLLSYPLCLCS